MTKRAAARLVRGATWWAAGALVVMSGTPIAAVPSAKPQSWQLHDPGLPPARSHPSVVYDVTHRRSVLTTGGSDSSGPLGDTWVLGSSGWSPLSGVGPPARTGATAVYDAARGGVVLFGGLGCPTGAGATGTVADGVSTKFCGDTWVLGSSGWSRLSGVGPPARAGATAVYDAARGGVVLFGGSGCPSDGGVTGTAADGVLTTYCGDTWVLGAKGWSRLSGVGPSARTDASAVYDAARNQVVLFGGSGCPTDGGVTGTAVDGVSTTSCVDTWVLGATGWSRLSGAGPPARFFTSMAYDAARGQVVIFGGLGSSGLLGDTWVLGLKGWSQLPGVGPPVRDYASMVYDASRRGVVLFGGQGSSGLLGDTWVLGSKRWTQVGAPAPFGVGPSARNLASAVYDESRGGVVLVGGSDSSGPLGDTWVLGWKGWSPAVVPPPARTGASVAYDAARRREVLFGGYGPSYATLDDTWVLGSKGWSQVSGAGPSPRGNALLVYDAARGRMVLFGGQNSSGWLGDTWVLGSRRWSRVSGAAPSARSGASMVYDAARKQVVLFGGLDSSSNSSSVYLSDTWVLGSKGWSQVSGVGPSARDSASVVYDAARKQVVLFGGKGSSSAGWLGDTWVLGSKGWSQVSGVGPSARTGASVVYDGARGGVVLFGGSACPRDGGVTGTAYDGVWTTLCADTWVLGSTGWSQVSGVGPSARALAPVVYDAARRQVVLFGGFDSSSAPSDTWVLGSKGWSQVSDTGPPSRAGALMVYDATRGGVVLLEGPDSFGYWLGDTWVLS
jgi:hypothetical protein